MSALQPWREQLRDDPARVVAGVLDSWLDRGPWQRAEPMDFLLDLADGDTELSELTAAATLDWARDRLSWDDSRRLRSGEISHASRLADAFAVLQRLEAPRAAYQLAEQHAWFDSRTRPLQFDGHLDLHRLLWWAIAFQQPDQRFVTRWLEFCGRAAGLRPDWKEWLRLGMTGLRMVEAPPDTLSVDQHALAGLLLFHQRLKAPVPDEVAAFERRQLGVLKELFPRGPTYWDDRLTEVRERWPERRDTPEWLKTPGRNGKNAPRQSHASTLPTEQERKAMVQRIRREAPGRALWEAIEGLFHRCQDHAFRTGECEFLVKTVSNLGDKFLKRRPDADWLRELLGWIRIGLDWDARNAYLWTRLAECLSALNQDQAAEHIRWEAMRRFPDNVVCRTSLAELLIGLQRWEEAETLLRETMARFPDDVVCRTSLAELLIGLQRWAEAETLLRETMARFPNDSYNHNILAKILIRRGEMDEAGNLLREVLRHDPNNEVSLAMLDSMGTGEASHMPDNMSGFLAPQFGKGVVPPGGEIEDSWTTDDSGDEQPIIGMGVAVEIGMPQSNQIQNPPGDAVTTNGARDGGLLPRAPSRSGEFAAPPARHSLPDPIYAWVAARAPITRLVFGFDREAETRERLTEAARTGGAAELAEVALRLLFPDEATPLDDALCARPGSPALRLLRADKDAAQGRRIAEDVPETRPVIEALYQTEADSEAWRYRFRAAVLACADLSPPPVWPGASVAA